METVRKRYRKLKGLGPDSKVPKVMVLETEEEKKAMMKHVKCHFDSVGSKELSDLTVMDEFLDFRRTKKGLECDILVRYKGEEKSVYFELGALPNYELKDVLKNLGIGGELHVHVRGKDGQDVAKQLASYFVSKNVEPIKEEHPLGITYKYDGYKCKDAVITSEHGLHARPAALFVKEANKYKAEILVDKDGQEANAKSIMNMLMLAATKGSRVIMKAKGPDAEKALDRLYKLCENKFGED